MMSLQVSCGLGPPPPPPPPIKNPGYAYEPRPSSRLAFKAIIYSSMPFIIEICSANNLSQRLCKYTRILPDFE